MRGEENAKRDRKRQHPLPDRHAWDHPIDQAGSRVSHAPRAARGAKPTTLTGKRGQLLVGALARRAAPHPRGQAGALLRRLFELGCRYSGQVLSYTKMLGQLQDAGNATTLAHYLELLAGAGMVTGLQKYAGATARRHGSSPKLQVLNTALMSAPSGLTLAEAHADPVLWGRLVESAIGAHLANAAAAGACEPFYWREGSREVDFVVRAGKLLIARSCLSRR